MMQADKQVELTYVKCDLQKSQNSKYFQSQVVVLNVKCCCKQMSKFVQIKQQKIWLGSGFSKRG